MLVGVFGDVQFAGALFLSGHTRFYEAESPARLVTTRLVPITVWQGRINGDASTTSVPSLTHVPSVDLGVPIETTNIIEFNTLNPISTNPARITLSANNSASAFLIRNWFDASGTIIINSATPFGTSNVQVIGGTSIEVKDSFATVPNRVLNNNFFTPQRYDPFGGPDDVTVPSPMEFKGSGNLTFNGNLTTQYNVGMFAGQGLGIIMSGSDTLTLNGVNDFGVGVTINSGTLAVGNNAALNGQGALVLNGGDIQASGAPRTVTPPSIIAKKDFAVTGMQDLNLNAPMDLNAGTRTANISAPVATIGGAITNGELRKKGTGILVLSGLSTYTGGTTVEAGVLQLNNGGPTGAIRGTVGVLNNGTLRLNATNSLGYNTGAKVDVINVVGGLIDNVADGDNGWGLTVNLNGATMRTNNGTNSPTTPKRYAMGGGSTISSIASATSSVISGRLDLRESNPNGTLSINVNNGAAAEDLVIRAAITEMNGSFGITKTGPGTLLLVGGNNDTTGGASTYTGSTIVNAGVLAVDGSQNANRLSNNNQVVINSGGTFEVRGVNTLPTNANAVDVTVNQGGTFRVVSGGSAFIGTATESHAHLRNVTLNGGTIDLPYSGTLSNWNGESFQLNGDLTVSGTVPSTIQSNAPANRQGVSFNGLRTIQVDDVTLSSATDLNINAELQSSSSTPADDGFRKTGAGTLALNNANIYLGPTMVDQGTIVLNGTLAGSTTVNNGGKLAGTGSARTVNVNTGGILSPGNGIGTLATQTVAFSGGTLQLEINSNTLTRDVLSIVGDIILGPSPAELTIADLGSTALPDGTSFTLLTYTGNWDGQLFAWSGVPVLDNGIFTVGPNLFRMDYGDASTKSFSIVAIPEPATFLVFGVAAGLLAARRRRPYFVC